MSDGAIDLQHQFYDMLMQSQYWSPERMRDYQRSQLSQLLRHAKKNVPFYENRLDAVLKPNGDIDWDRWSEIPIVKRSDMVEHRDAMLARELPPGHGGSSVLETSGSTGLPIKISVNALTGIANNAFRWRVHRWQDLDWSKSLCSRMGETDNRAEWPGGEPMGFWGPDWDTNARRGATWRITRQAPSEEVFDLIRNRRCAYFNAGPNMAHINALDALKLGIDVQIEAILVQGNVVRQADRDICQQVFGAKLVEHYSSKEGGQMAHPCAAGALHVNGEGVLVEILDQANRPCGIGEVGRVVITPLYQTAQPLVRYDQGDLASIGAPCTCGRHSLVLGAVIGRSIAIFRHPDGRSIANLMPDRTTDLLRCRYWQLAQTGPNNYEFRYVPTDWQADGDEAAVAGLFRETFFDDADIRFVRTRAIPANPAGKLVEYISEWGVVS